MATTRDLGKIHIFSSETSYNSNKGQVGDGDLSLVKIPQLVYVAETYTNETEWYRIWSDGWIEQGGVFTAAVANGAQQKINLLKTMSNSNYVVFLAFKNTSTTLTYGSGVYMDRFMPNSITPSSFQYIVSTDERLKQISWYVCGY